MVSRISESVGLFSIRLSTSANGHLYIDQQRVGIELRFSEKRNVHRIPDVRERELRNRLATRVGHNRLLDLRANRVRTLVARQFFYAVKVKAEALRVCAEFSALRRDRVHNPLLPRQARRRHLSPSVS